MKDILIIEKENGPMNRASYVNQARVHNGYHYPRSVLTGYRSAVNFQKFVNQYEPAIYSDFDKYYAISKQLSKINSNQFRKFAEKIGAEVQQANRNIKDLFSSSHIEEVFKVKEYAFDSRKLRDLLIEKIRQRPEIKIHTREEVISLRGRGGLIIVVTSKGEYKVNNVINCSYSNINTLHRASGLPLVGLKHEITEMCLVSLPDKLRKFSVTIMDGPFFSIMPFPSKKLWTLSHVRYTPHESWIDDGIVNISRDKPHEYLSKSKFSTNYKQMYNDVVRYIPSLSEMKYVESIVEVKTVLTKSEGDDSRPILFQKDNGIANYACILGGKLDNIYDVFEVLEEAYGY